MPWFRKSSDDESTEAQQAAPAAVNGPVLEPLTNAEIDWVRSSIADLAEQDVRLGDIDDLGRHYNEMLTAWLRLNESQRPDPDKIINEIGLAFGQYVADRAKLDWMIATDENGAEIALNRTRGNVLIYPTILVARQWAAHQRDVLPALASNVIATVEEIR